jgi:hypothetical protein
MAVEQSSTQVETAEQVKGTLKIGAQGIVNPTPMWATWIFRIEFFLNKALLYYFTTTTTAQMSAEEVKHWLVVLIAIDGFVWGIGKSMGIKPPEDSKS